MLNIKEEFTRIYREGQWGLKSGIGSTLENSVDYVLAVRAFMVRHHIRSIVDCGCGYLQLTKHFDLSGIKYTGIDVVEQVINEVKEEFPRYTLFCGDFMDMDLPEADLLICKDVLQHLPNSIVATFLRKTTHYKYRLITNDIGNNIFRDPYVTRDQYCGLNIREHPFHVKGDELCRMGNKITILTNYIPLPVTVPRVLLAIHAKQGEHLLPKYLECIERLDYPKSNIHLHIRTNNNTDGTAKILEQWMDKVKDKYSGVDYDSNDVATAVEKYGVHEWNSERCGVLAKIRQTSMRRTLETKCDYYFVADVDNFIAPHTLRDIIILNLPIVGPMLQKINEDGGMAMYASFHYAHDDNGYYKDHPHYNPIVNREMKGLFEVSVVHCTYAIRADVIPLLSYIDNSGRLEYVVFSDSARKARVKQYIDNRSSYGVLTMENAVDKIPFLNIL